MPVAGSSKPRGAIGALKDQLFGTKEERKAHKLKKKEEVISFTPGQSPSDSNSLHRSALAGKHSDSIWNKGSWPANSTMQVNPNVAMALALGSAVARTVAVLDLSSEDAAVGATLLFQYLAALLAACCWVKCLTILAMVALAVGSTVVVSMVASNFPHCI